MRILFSGAFENILVLAITPQAGSDSYKLAEEGFKIEMTVQRNGDNSRDLQNAVTGCRNACQSGEEVEKSRGIPSTADPSVKLSCVPTLPYVQARQREKESNPVRRNV